jgi:hypothetical protein
MPRINRHLLILEDILDFYPHSKVIEKLIDYEDIFERLELDKKLLMFGFEENDVEAQQLIDTIELQQFYLIKNILVLKEALMIKEKNLIIIEQCHGVTCQIGIN